MYHEPALLKETINGLSLKPDGVYLDATFGGGGHSRAILNGLSNDGKLYAFDQDLDVLTNIPEDSRIEFVYSNFRFIKRFMKFYEEDVDGILADLGVSSHHFDAEDRGFSFRFDGELDMRMNRNQGISAKEYINSVEEVELFTVLKEYGEVPNARRMAREIVQTRNVKSIQTTKELAAVIEGCSPKRTLNQFLAKAFQAIRLVVNNEMGVLRQFLVSSADVLKPGGRLAVISYHSLEDRLVKNFFRSGNLEGKIEKDFYGNIQTPWKVITRKVIVPTDEEISRNNRARSARLRIAEKL